MKLITFTNGIDARCREPKAPTVARFYVTPTTLRYIVIGTEYGYLHTTAGDVHTWVSYSGAKRSANHYRGL